MSNNNMTTGFLLFSKHYRYDKPQEHWNKLTIEKQNFWNTKARLEHELSPLQRSEFHWDGSDGSIPTGPRRVPSHDEETVVMDEEQIDAHIKDRIESNWELVVKLYCLAQWPETHHHCGEKCTKTDSDSECESGYSGDTEFTFNNELKETVYQLFG